MRIHQKLMLVFIVTTLLPIVLLTNYFFSQTGQLINRSVSESYQKVLLQSNSSIDYNIRFYESILDSLTVSQTIQSVLTEPDKNRQKGIFLMSEEIKKAVSFIEAYQATYVERIEFFSLVKDTLSDGRFLFPYERLQKEYSFASPPDSNIWVLDKADGRYDYALIRPIYDLKGYGKIGYIKLTVQIPAITNVQEASMLDKSNLVIADRNGTMIYNQDPAHIGKPLPKEIARLAYSGSESGIELDSNVNLEDYAVWYRKLKNVEWTTFLIAPKRQVDRELRDMHRTNLIISVLCAMVFTLLSLLITRQITDGIRRLHAKVMKVGKGMLVAPAVSKALGKRGRDEVAELDRNFDKMLFNLRELIHQNYVEKLERREMELNFLQTQIKSHFLYNTLDAIKNEIDLDEKENAIKMVVSLADLFRISVSKGQNMIRWEDEIEHAKSYLAIQEIRFGTGCRVIWDIEPQINRMYTLKIMLQPIIENAILHGLQGVCRSCEIRITGTLAADSAVMFRIKDNGAGMDPEQVHALLENKESRKGIGLKNIRDRIHMYFGDEYGLRIASSPGEGTEVTLILPKLESGKDV